MALPMVDAVEVANAGNDPVNDYYARLYAREYGLTMTAGSDNHRSHEGSTIFGVGFQDRLTSEQDFAARIRQHCQPTLLVPTERWQKPVDPVLPLECELLDTQGGAYRYRQPWLQDGPFAPWLKGEADD